MGEPPGQPKLVSHESLTTGWPGRSKIPGPFRVLREAKRRGSIELLGRLRREGLWLVDGLVSVGARTRSRELGSSGG